MALRQRGFTPRDRSKEPLPIRKPPPPRTVRHSLVQTLILSEGVTHPLLSMDRPYSLTLHGVSPVASGQTDTVRVTVDHPEQLSNYVWDSKNSLDLTGLPAYSVVYLEVSTSGIYTVVGELTFSE